LYAIGVVGAIATNLGASATDRRLDLKKWERGLMMITFLIMLAIELSLFWDKPKARIFATTVLVVGLVMRGLAAEAAQRKKRRASLAAGARKVELDVQEAAGGSRPEALARSPLLCAVRGVGRTLEFAVEAARAAKRPLYVLFVRALPVITLEDRNRRWQEDAEARAIFSFAFERAQGHVVFPCYCVSDAAAETIVDIAATLGASELVLGASTRSGLVSLLGGSVVREVSQLLPEEIYLLICS